MNKEYVQEYIRLEKEHWWFLVREKFIHAFLKKNLSDGGNQKLHILNIGVSGGATTKVLEYFGDVVSVETEAFFISYLREQNIQVTEASITQLPFADNHFDLVCAFDVIEHVENDQQALREMQRVCKANGSICISVPAFQQLWSNHDVVNLHYRRYTKNAFKKLVDIFPQLSNIKMIYFNSLLFLPVWAIRKVSNLFSNNKSKEKSDFTRFKTTGIINRLMKFIFGLEILLLGKINFPFGVSLIALLRKDSKNKI